jgi:hypothetical protein
MKYVKSENVVIISRVVVVHEENVVKVKSVNQIYVCVGSNEVVVVHMNIVFMESVSVKQVHAINVIIHVNQMKCV